MNAQHIADEILVTFAAGELAPADAQIVANHAASCSTCARTVALFKTIRFLVRTDESRDPPSAAVMRARSIFKSLAPSPHIAYDQLIAFAADDLDTVDARAVAQHTASCNECTRIVTQFKKVRAVMRADPSRNPPAAVVARAQTIFTPKRSPASVPFWQKWHWSISVPTTRRLANAFLLILLVLSNLIVYIGVGRTVEASQAAIPGDSLYAVKLVIEDVQLATTWDTAGKLARHLTYAGYRLDETGALIALDRFAEIPGTLAAFEKQVGLVATTFKTLARENFKRAQELTPQIEASLAERTARLETLRQQATDSLQPVFASALQVTNASRANVRNLVTPPSPTPSPTSLPLPTNTRVFDSSQPIAPTLTKTSPAVLPRTATAAPTQPLPPGLPNTSTPAPAQPPVVRSPTPLPTKPPVVSSPTATRTQVVPTPSKTPQPSWTPSPTRIPPGLEKKTLTPVPWSK